MAAGIPLNDEDRWDWLILLRDQALLHLKEGRHSDCQALRRRPKRQRPLRLPSCRQGHPSRSRARQARPLHEGRHGRQPVRRARGARRG
jgi:hypothetical protein